MCEWVHCRDEASSHQLPIAADFWIISAVSVGQCSSLRQNLMQIPCCTCSVILNVMATQCTCSLNTIYCPHWLVQWSHCCSCMRIPVHSPWLPAYINVVQIILIILTMAGFFSKQTSYMLFLGSSVTSTKIGHILNHKTHHNKFTRMEIIQSVYPDQNRIKLAFIKKKIWKALK